MTDLNFKNRKVVVYIALAHHTRFLTPIMKRFEQLGAEVLYVVGQAERSQEITAIERDLNFVHVFDYITEKDKQEINENYLTLRNGMARGIKKDIAIGATNALTVLDKTIHSAAIEYIGFRNLLEAEKPDICFALHELNRWGKMMAFWAKKRNIPVVTLQEGLYAASNYKFIGHVQFSTLNLVWGSKTHQKLIGYEAPGERIIPVGNTHIAQEIIRLEQDDTRSKMRHKFGLDEKYAVLLLFSAAPSPLEDLEPLFNHLLDNERIRLFCKFHPVAAATLIDEWKAGISEPIKKEIIFIHDEESTYALVSMSDLCVLSEPSTTGLEALAIGKPLVQLKLSKPEQYPYNFVEARVAMHLTPQELADKLSLGENFSTYFSSADINNFIEEELTDTTGATERIVGIAEKMISANADIRISPFSFQMTDPDDGMIWSIIIPVSDDAQLLLSVLESISEFSENAGRYEVILVLPERISDQTETILNALEGDVTLVKSFAQNSMTERLNKGIFEAKGQRLVILMGNISPGPDWLDKLGKAYSRYPGETIFGARILNRYENIVHAGMVVDANNAPTSAYQHLDEKFPNALKERAFQMVDHFLSLDRSFFGRLGGFHPKAGHYGIMDLCLRAFELTKQNMAYYIPDVKLTKLSTETRPFMPDESTYFFSRWHGALWESEASLYKTDNVSQVQLDAARMTRVMNVLNR